MNFSERVHSGPQEVMLCLLALSSGTQDAAVQIQHVLIRAFCQEHAVPLLHVYDQAKLTQLLHCCLAQPGAKAASGALAKAAGKEVGAGGVSCIMIKVRVAFFLFVCD